MKKKLNSLSDLSTIKFDNLSPDKEDNIDPIKRNMKSYILNYISAKKEDLVK